MKTRESLAWLSQKSKDYFGIATLTSFLLGLMLCAIGFAIGSAQPSRYTEKSELQNIILDELNVSGAEKSRYRDDDDPIFLTSSRSQEYQALLIKIRQEDRRYFIPAVLVFILGLLMFILAPYVFMSGLESYWQGEGLDEDSLSKRRNKILTRLTILSSALFLFLLITWRITASYRRSGSGRFLFNFQIFTGITFGVVLFCGLSAYFANRIIPIISTSQSFSKTHLLGFISLFITFVSYTFQDDTEMFNQNDTVVAFALGAQAIWLLSFFVFLGCVIMIYLKTPKASQVHTSTRVKEKPEAESISAEPESEPEKMTNANDLTQVTPPPAPIEPKAETTTTVALEPKENSKAGGAQAKSSIQQLTQLTASEVVRERSEISRQRLITEVDSLTRRGNLNLTLGSLFTGIAVFILWWLVSQAPTDLASKTVALRETPIPSPTFPKSPTPAPSPSPYTGPTPSTGTVPKTTPTPPTSSTPSINPTPSADLAPQSLVSQDPATRDEIRNLVIYFLPRVSLAIFIEIFAFFFLRLYKNSLSEILYYQNELTNIESKMFALEIASLTSPKVVDSILLELVKTDRNYVLKKGETTIELEKSRVEPESFHAIVKALIEKLPATKLDTKSTAQSKPNKPKKPSSKEDQE